MILGISIYERAKMYPEVLFAVQQKHGILSVLKGNLFT